MYEEEGSEKIHCLMLNVIFNQNSYVVSEFVLHSLYYIPYRVITFGFSLFPLPKGMKPLILPAMG